MKDRLNNELQIGDIVIYVTGHYNTLYTGIIKKFTPKNVSIAQIDACKLQELGLSRFKISLEMASGDQNRWSTTIHPSQVLKINDSNISK